MYFFILLTINIILIHSIRIINNNPFRINHYRNRISSWTSMQLNDVIINEPIRISKSNQLTQFSRTNRVDGLNKWLNEVKLWKDALDIQANNQDNESINQESLIKSQIALLTEISKELLYSGIPEQSLELYSVYNNILSNYIDKSLNIIPDSKLIILATRSYVAMNDITGALKLLQSCSRAGLSFDSESKCQLITELAVSSPQGLKAALQLRISMLERNEVINTNACSAILKGIWMHGLKLQSYDNTLLIDKSSNAMIDNDLSTDPLNNFRLSVDKAYQIANDIMNYHSNQRKGKTKRTYKVAKEYIRILFYITVLTSQDVIDNNYDDDITSKSEILSKEGLVILLEAMSTYQINWNIYMTDLLLEYCLLILPKYNIYLLHYILSIMQKNAIYTETTSWNTLLNKYLSICQQSDDEIVRGTCADISYDIVLSIMNNNQFCTPNMDTIDTLLDICIYTQKGRFYAKQLINYLLDVNSDCELSNDDMSILNKLSSHISNRNDKRLWDKYIYISIYDNLSIYPIIKQMISLSDQPNENTVINIMKHNKITKQWKESLELAQILIVSNVLRNRYKNYVLSTSDPVDIFHYTRLYYNSFVNKDIGLLNIPIDIVLSIGLYLPIPSNNIMKELFLILKDNNRYEESVALLLKLLDYSNSTQSINQSNRQFNAGSSVGNSNINGDIKPLISQININIPNSLTNYLIPNDMIFSCVMETCINSQKYQQVLQIFHIYESLHLSDQSVDSADGNSFKHIPSRQIYNCLIKAFSSVNNWSNAMGVFQEMISHYKIPDIYTLKSLLTNCIYNPIDIRQIVILLDDLSNNNFIDLDVYSKNILMESYTDSISLSLAFKSMITFNPNNPSDIIETSLSVLNVLVQTLRKDKSLESIQAALNTLGSLGIRPDRETLEYFTIPDRVIPNSPFSRHIIRQLIPNQLKQRSLLDMEMPDGLGPDLEILSNDTTANSKYNLIDKNTYVDIIEGLKLLMNDNERISRRSKDVHDMIDWAIDSDYEAIEANLIHNNQIITLIDDFINKQNQSNHLSNDIISNSPGKYTIPPSDSAIQKSMNLPYMTDGSTWIDNKTSSPLNNNQNLNSKRKRDYQNDMQREKSKSSNSNTKKKKSSDNKVDSNKSYSKNVKVAKDIVKLGE